MTNVGGEPPAGVVLRPIARRRGWGPEPAMIDLAGWAAHRWAGRRPSFLATASATGAVRSLPPAARTRPPTPRVAGEAATALATAVDTALAQGTDRPVVLRLPPALDITPLVARVGQRGPVLVVVPTVAAATALASRLRRAGAGVALLPDEWARARAGAAVVIGSRAAAWAPAPELAAVVVVDGHDEALHQQQHPTWDAATVAAERARRLDVPCLVTSPCPTPELAGAAGRIITVPVTVERAGWAPVEVLDRSGDDPRLGLYSERLVSLVRSGARVACVLNRVGRARLLSCRACGSVARCERCGSAVAEKGDGADRHLTCGRCGLSRPWVCTTCASTALRQLRVGVTRAAEDLATLAGRPVREITAATTGAVTTGASDDGAGDLVVGTEAVLHRGGRWDAVAFLDLDGDLLAPRFRAAAESFAMLALASRLVGGRRAGGRVVVQTRVPDHPVIHGAAAGDPGPWLAEELALRRDLDLPPYSALASLAGDGAAELAAALAGDPDVVVQGPSDDRWLVRAGNAGLLAGALDRVGRPAERVRISVDPLRV